LAPHERWRIQRIYPDGRRELVTVAGVPWEGNQVQGQSRIGVLTRKEPKLRFELVPPA
jgi:hypothetical protein